MKKLMKLFDQIVEEATIQIQALSNIEEISETAIYNSVKPKQTNNSSLTIPACNSNHVFLRNRTLRPQF